jgi:shikimate dehydrogenase
MTVHIRPPTWADIDALIALNAEIQALHHQALPHLFKPASGGEAVKDLFVQLMGGAANTFLVAIADDAVAGYLFCETRERAETALTYASRAVYNHHLGVDAQFRRRGIGRALIAAAQSLATERGIKRIEVDFWSFNDEAREFYAALGFVSFNERWWRALA